MLCGPLSEFFPTTLETSAASDLTLGMKLGICNCETLDISIHTEGCI